MPGVTSPPANPIVDDRGATFVWRGAGAPPTVVGQWCDWDPAAGLTLRRTGEIWQAHLELPAAAYVEYGLVRDGESVVDPLNPATVDNGVGGRNHRFWMPGAARRALALARRRVPRGEVTHGVVHLGWLTAAPNLRRLATYLPHDAVGDAALRRDLPLLLVLDGLDYLRRGRLARILDALIADRSMAPIAAAFIDDAGPARSAEYAANDFTLAALAELVVPAAIDRLGIGSQAAPAGLGRATVLGSSLGGLMALHAGLRRPDVFGQVIAQSTAGLVEELTVGTRSVPPIHSTLLALIQATTPPPIRAWLDVGLLEGLVEPNDRLVGILRGRGLDPAYRHFPGGHDQTSWAESLVDALPAMFPPLASARP
jgi:enterochelin esterase family protein